MGPKVKLELAKIPAKLVLLGQKTRLDENVQSSHWNQSVMLFLQVLIVQAPALCTEYFSYMDGWFRDHVLSENEVHICRLGC